MEAIGAHEQAQWAAETGLSRTSRGLLLNLTSGRGLHITAHNGNAWCVCFSPHALACPARAQAYDPSQAPTLEEFSSVEFSELSPKQLAGSIWNFAKQGSSPSRDLMDAIAAEVHSKLCQFRCD